MIQDDFRLDNFFVDLALINAMSLYTNHDTT